MDALIEVPPLTVAELDGEERGESSATIGQRVCAARAFARQRSTQSVWGARSPIEEQAGLSREARKLLRQALVDDRLSGRGYARVIRLARTIADLDEAEAVLADHAAEALGLRLDHRRVGLFS